MEEIEIKTWEDFIKVITNHPYKTWLYRGQSNSEWKLESSLFRNLNRNSDIQNFKNSPDFNKVFDEIKGKYEKIIIKQFIDSAHLYLSKVPDKDNILEWLSIMQHYGTPTRMLDFSFSPYVALFFALSEIQNSAAVYCLNVSKLNITTSVILEDLEKKHRKIMRNETDLDKIVLFPFEPNFTNERLLAQQGAFLIPNTLIFSHDDILNQYNKEDAVFKLIINIRNTKILLEELIRMNMSFTNLYPGFAGFCKSFETISILPYDKLKTLNINYYDPFSM